MKKRMRIALAMGILVLMLGLLNPVEALHDPPGTQARTGTIYSGNSKMVAFVVSGYSSTIWTTVDVDEYKGDLDIHGHMDMGLAQYVDFYCLIKVKPADSTYKYLELSIDADFQYAISAAFGASASWTVQYVVVDMGQNPPVRRGWSSYTDGDSVSWGYKDNQDWDSTTAYKELYDGTDYEDYYEFSTSNWYYVGVWVRCGLYMNSDFYKTTQQQGDADWDTHSISWRFFR